MYNPSSLIRIANSFGHNSSSMNWLAPALSAGSSLLGSLFSAHSANKALNAQRQENALNRQFNAAEAQKSRDFQLDMFNRENAYNDPKAVVGRLMNAGMNPALAFGNIADSASVSGGSAASYGSGVNPPMPDWSGISSAGSVAMQREMMQAQIDVLKSQANKNDKETDWIDKAKSQELLESNSRIHLNSALEFQSQKQAEVFVKSVESLDKQMKLWDSQIGLNNSEKALKESLHSYQEIINKYGDEYQRQQLAESRSRCESLAAKMGLDRAQAAEISQLLPYLITQEKTKAYSSEEELKVLHEFFYVDDEGNYSPQHDNIAKWRRMSEKQKLEVLEAAESGRDVDYVTALTQALTSTLQIIMAAYLLKGAKVPKVGFK